MMKSPAIIVLLLILTVDSFSSEKRNLLTDHYSRKYVNSVLLKNHSWIDYPSYNNRSAWSRIPEGIRTETIREAEKYLHYNWPAITATIYLEFTRTGNRSIVDSANSRRQDALRSLVLAELIEGKKRFLDDIVNGVFAVCEQTYWGASAHFYLYGFDHSEGTINKPFTVLPDRDDPIIDLMVSEMAADLAWIYYFFYNEFDTVSPIISKRLKNELKDKVLNPYYERFDLWWITGWGEGDRFYDWNQWTMNNWTTWCTSNMLTCILLMEEDPQKKLNGIYKTMASIDLFLNFYPEDGVCDEGPGYWRHAGGKLFDYLDLLKRSTDGKIDIFGNELVKNIGRYIYRVYISKGEHYINFASAGQKIRYNGGHIFRFGEAIDDPVMKGFGAFLLRESSYGEKAAAGSLGEALGNLFHFENWQETSPSEPLIPEFYFPDSEIALARDEGGSTDGFYFAAWGGNNGGGHSHPDVGSCILFFNGAPILIDVGRSSTRSVMHNVPLINGIGQTTGGIYKAKGSKYSHTGKKVTFSTDIAGAYSSEAGAEKWIRTYTLERGKRFSIHDQFQLSKNQGNTKFHFITGNQIRLVNPGIIELSGNGFILNLRYDPSSLSASIEDKILNNEISRIAFDLKSNSLSGDVLFELSEAELPENQTK